MKLFGFNEWCRVNESILINEDFKTQRQRFIDEGNSPEEVDKYLADFREIKDKKFGDLIKFSSKEILQLSQDEPVTDEQEKMFPVGENRFNVDLYRKFSDLVAAVTWVSARRPVGHKNFSSLDLEGTIVYSDNVLEIYYAPSKRACVEYRGGMSYSWCIARSDSSNLFDRYRGGQYHKEPAFYFVKLKERTKAEFEYWNSGVEPFTGKFKDKYHLVVIQKPISEVKADDNKYVLTSADNDGDRYISWKKIVELIPELNNVRQYFKPVPISQDERKSRQDYAFTISDSDFIKLPYREKEKYIDIYVGKNQYSILSDAQFISLPEDLKNKYVGLGLRLTREQVDYIKLDRKLLKRYSDSFATVVKESPWILGTLYDFEYDILAVNSNPNNICDILIKYVIDKLETTREFIHNVHDGGKGLVSNAFKNQFKFKGVIEKWFTVGAYISGRKFGIADFHMLDFLITNGWDKLIIASSTNKNFEKRLGMALLHNNPQAFKRFTEDLNITLEQFVSTLTPEEKRIVFLEKIGQLAKKYPNAPGSKYPQLYMNFYSNGANKRLTEMTLNYHNLPFSNKPETLWFKLFDFDKGKEPNSALYYSTAYRDIATEDYIKTVEFDESKFNFDYDEFEYSDNDVFKFLEDWGYGIPLIDLIYTFFWLSYSKSWRSDPGVKRTLLIRVKK